MGSQLTDAWTTLLKTIKSCQFIVLFNIIIGSTMSILHLMWSVLDVLLWFPSASLPEGFQVGWDLLCN